MIITSQCGMRSLHLSPVTLEPTITHPHTYSSSVRSHCRDQPGESPPQASAGRSNFTPLLISLSTPFENFFIFPLFEYSVIVLICNLTFHFPHSLSFISFFLLLISAFFSQTSFSHSLFLLCPLSYSLYFLSSFFKAILISKLCKSSHPCSLTYIYSNCSSLCLRDYSIWPMLLATASLDPTSSISNQAVILAGHLAALDKTGL